MSNGVAWPVALHLASGLGVTLEVALFSTLLATVLGVVLGALSQSGRPGVSRPVRAYVEVFRGVPSLLTLLFVFFVLPQAGITTSPLTAASLGLGLWGAAGVAEIARGALASIHPHQMQAGRALGLSARRAMLHVLLPQAARRFLPSYVGQLTVLVQASVLTSVVGVTDLLGSARQMIEQLAYVTGHSHALAIYGAVMLVFFLICYPLSVLASLLERRLRA